MSYHKMTTISGWKGERPGPAPKDATAEDYAAWQARYDAANFITVRRGHWTPEAADRLARRAGCVGTVEVIHSVADMSGRGRGGYDRAFEVAPDGTVSRRGLSRAEAEYNEAGDADEIHALYDEAEGAR